MMSILLRTTRIHVLTSFLLVAIATAAISADQSCVDAGVPPEALGNWQQLEDPSRMIRITDGTLLEYVPPAVTSMRGLITGPSCEVHAVTDGEIESLAISMDTAGHLVLARGEVRETYRRLAQTPPELEMNTPAIRPPQEVSPDLINEVREELKRRYEEDQAFLKAIHASERDERDYAPLRRQNNSYLRALLDEVGWIDDDVFGVRTTYYAFMLLQHSSDLGLMRATAPYVERDLEGSKYVDAYALFFDRLQIIEGKPQRYGTQMARLPNGEAVVLPIEDSEHVEERRRSLGMQPLGEYLDGAAKFLFHGKRPQHYDFKAVSAALSAADGEALVK